MRGTPVGLGFGCREGIVQVVWCGSIDQIGWQGGTPLMTSAYKRGWSPGGVKIGVGSLDLEVVGIK